MLENLAGLERRKVICKNVKKALNFTTQMVFGEM